MFLKKIKYNLENNNELVFYENDSQRYTYKELYILVKKIYKYLIDNRIKGNVIVYGHKQIEMIATFLACSFAGVTYIPVDTSTPQDRINYIIEETNPNAFFAYDYCQMNVKCDIVDHKNKIFINQEVDIDLEIKIKEQDVYYIIYTSGSTGNPKGVQITYKNLDTFVNWFNSTIGKNKIKVLNQALFSFDLSVADIYFSLTTSSTLCIIDVDFKSGFNEMFDILKTYNVNMTVMTPSFIELLLIDKNINKENFPNLEVMYFCGEVLHKKTVDKIKERFGDIRIINSYGPTECTVAVTENDVQNLDEENIPIGYVKQGTKIYIVDDNKCVLGDGKVGEIIITGDSVSKGYFKNELSRDKFIVFNNKKAYVTGDIGYMKNNKLYFVSRKDEQVKYSGYRIELNDITNNLYKLKYIDKVYTVANKNDSNKVVGITSFIKLRDDFKRTINPQEIKRELKEKIPNYMMPRIKIVNRFELNSNGKLDVKRMEDLWKIK